MRDAASPLVAFWTRLDQPELGDAISVLRERFGLSRSQLCQRMSDMSAEADLGADESLVYRWEKGEKGRPRPRPGPQYRALLGRVCEREVETLSPIARREFLRQLVALTGPPLILMSPATSLLVGAEPWRTGPHTSDLGAAGLTAGVVGPGMTAADVAQLTAHYEHLRRRVPGAHLIGPVRAHLDFIARYLRETSLPSSVRPGLVSAVGEVAVLAGRLSFWDLHDEAAARQYFEMAGTAAHEAGDRGLAAYALAFTAELATYVRQPGQAGELSRAAQGIAIGVTTPRVQSWLASVEAEADAHLDEVESCLRALDRAREAMARTGTADQDPPWIEFFDLPRLHGYEGACLVKTGQPRPALHALRKAAEETNPSLQRYHAEIAADTAWALVQENDVEIEESCRLLAAALESASAVGYRDGLRRVRNVRQRLAPWGHTRAVRDLDERLRFA